MDMSQCGCLHVYTDKNLWREAIVTDFVRYQMRRQLHFTLALILLTVGSGAIVAAQSALASPQPPVLVSPPPSGSAPPPVSLRAAPPALYDAVSFGFPHDFHFDDHLYGSGFKPGERVTVRVSNVSAPVQQTTAGNDGSFSVEMPYTWVFCDANGARHPAPIFSANGDLGSAASVTRLPAPCPLLFATWPDLKAASPTGSGSGSVVASGTAVAVPIPVGPPASGQQPAPIAQSAPRLATMPLNGFGFVPGERVSVQQLTSSLYPALPPITGVADARGRIQFPVQVYLPPFCSGPFFVPQLVATGDHGTSVVSTVFVRQLLMIACPYRRPPGAGTPAPGNPQPPAPGAVQNPSIAPVSPGAANATAPTNADITPALSFRLHPAVGHPGKLERAAVQTATGGRVSLSVVYPAHRVVHLSATVGAGGHTTLRWRTPRHTHTGAAHLTVSFKPGQLSLRGSFRVK